MHGNSSFGLAMREGFLEDDQSGYASIDLSALPDELSASPPMSGLPDKLQPLETAYQQLLDMFDDADAATFHGSSGRGSHENLSLPLTDTATSGLQIASATPGFEIATYAFDAFTPNGTSGPWNVWGEEAIRPAQHFQLGAAGSDALPVQSAIRLDDADPVGAKGGAAGPPSGAGGGSGGGGGKGGSLFTTYVSGDDSVDDANEFNIQIDFSGRWTAEQQAIVTWAADTLSSIIVGDIRDDTDLNLNFVDDIVISVSTGRLDGSGSLFGGNTLAQTQITAVRDPGSVDQWLPVTSTMTLDSTDLKNSVGEGWFDTWDDIVLHEMVHAIGFAGLIFDNLGLTDGGNFIGSGATTAYGGLVPIESDGGIGTAGSHWDEYQFQPGGVPMSNELMTGFIAFGEQTQLSDTTVAALSDMGYEVQDPSVGTGSLLVDSGLFIA